MADFCLYCGAGFMNEPSWISLFIPQPPRWLCGDCLTKLTPLEGGLCKKCSRPLSKLAPDYIHDGICSDCLRWEQEERWKDVLEKNVSLYEYNDFMKELTARFKFRGDYVLAKVFAARMQRALKSLDYDFVTVIPLSSERLRERGFNQAEALAAEAGIQTVILMERLHSEKQSKKSRNERIHTPNVFRLMPGADISGKKVLLIDDIYTTGSTLRHGARILKEAGAHSVLSITLAR